MKKRQTGNKGKRKKAQNATKVWFCSRNAVINSFATTALWHLPLEQIIKFKKVDLALLSFPAVSLNCPLSKY